ncbi:hypothetical protein QJQ45_013863 [Haematococcus lacustris]|nr:hypothetical protein QJQ45_013863 [Haematococcus lacustris]
MLISCTRGFCASKSCISTRPFKLRATPPLQPLPPLPQCKHFVNLTNGVEALPMLQDLGLSFSYVRLQSTACEQQRYEQLMMSLDANLLMALAVGHCTLVYDAGSRIPEWGVPRAVWQGLTFARWALTRLWLGPEAATVCGALVKGHNTTGIFEMHLDNFSGSTKKHLKWGNGPEMGQKVVFCKKNLRHKPGKVRKLIPRYVDLCNSRYCECFASGRHCEGCNCTNCFNNRENEVTRQTAVEAILERNPNAFRPKIQGSEQRAQVIACLNMQPMSSYSQVNEYGQPLMSREALAAGSPMKRARTNNSSPLTGLLQQHPLFLQQQLQQTHPLLLQSGLLPGGAPAAAAAAAAMAAAGMRTTPSFIPPALNLPGLPGLSLPAALQAQLQQQRQIAQAQLPQVAPPQQPLSQAPQLRAPNLNGLLTSMRFNMGSNETSETKPNESAEVRKLLCLVAPMMIGSCAGEAVGQHTAAMQETIAFLRNMLGSDEQASAEPQASGTSPGITSAMAAAVAAMLANNSDNSSSMSTQLQLPIPGAGSMAGGSTVQNLQAVAAAAAAAAAVQSMASVGTSSAAEVAGVMGAGGAGLNGGLGTGASQGLEAGGGRAPSAADLGASLQTLVGLSNTGSAPTGPWAAPPTAGSAPSLHPGAAPLPGLPELGAGLAQTPPGQVAGAAASAAPSALVGILDGLSGSVQGP